MPLGILFTDRFPSTVVSLWEARKIITLHEIFLHGIPSKIEDGNRGRIRFWFKPTALGAPGPLGCYEEERQESTGKTTSAACLSLPRLPPAGGEFRGPTASATNRPPQGCRHPGPFGFHLSK